MAFSILALFHPLDMGHVSMKTVKANIQNKIIVHIDSTTTTTITKHSNKFLLQI